MLREGENILELSAHRYGNYHKYYTFHSASARIQLLANRNLFRALWTAQGCPKVYRILDIGCNEGDLSIELLRAIRAELPEEVQSELVGADLDPSLIALAQGKHSEKGARFHCVDFLDPASVSAFETNLRTKLGEEAPAFHFVSIFSTTMWVHINHGETGLRTFFQHACEFVKPFVGAVLVEPQPAKCYKAAVKRCRKLGLPEPPAYRALEVQQVEDTVKDTLLHVRSFRHVLQLGREEWDRALNLFSDSDLNSEVLPAAASSSTDNEIKES